ncbi:MAG: hypothetical protein QOF30_1092, partial [Acidimicrobiaceae bacterium]|nr:hypothetical protein [Acidimicrobiaceae bacterium]
MVRPSSPWFRVRKGGHGIMTPAAPKPDKRLADTTVSATASPVERVTPSDVVRHLPEWIGEIVEPAVPLQPFPPRRARPDLQVDLIRPDDLLSLHIDGYNLHVVWTDEPHLDRIDATKEARLVVGFPPQNIAEGAYYKRAGDDKHPLKLPPGAPGASAPPPDGQPDGKLVAPGNVPAQLAGPSRLAFRIAAGAAMPFVPYTMEGLLDWSKFEPVVPALADIGPNPSPAEIAQAPDITPPGATETALELPYRLLLAPQRRARWAH